MSEPDDDMNRDVNLKARHLDEVTCLLYLERQLDRARGQEVSAHAADCASCKTLLRALERESRLLTRSLLEEDEPLPSRLAAFQERARKSMQWIWGLVFGLAATGIYALYQGYVQPLQTQLDQAGFGGSNLLSLMIFQGAFWKGWQPMLTLIEVLAMVTVGVLCAVFFRRRLRRGSAMALVVAGLCGMMALPQQVAASQMRHADTITVGKGEKIKSDLFVTAGRCRIDGEVDGDLYAFCQSVDVNGHVTGDVIGFAQSVRVNGVVDGNVRIGCNNLTLSGTLGKNVLAFGDSIRIDSDAKTGGSATVFGGTIALDGTLGRDVLSFARFLSITGTVGGGVKARGDTLSISSTAKIDGATDFEGQKAPDVASEAKLGSPVKFTKVEPKPEYRSGHYYVWQVIWAAAFVLFGLVLFTVMPDFSRQAVDSAERVGASLGLGVLVGCGAPIAALIACITVVGLFLGLSTFFLWYASLYFAQIIVGALLGQWLMGRNSELWPLIGRMIVGLLIVRLCFLIPHIGIWLKIGVILWGVGAMSLAIYRRMQPLVAQGVPAVPSPIPPGATIGGMQPV
jgi:cytoskeletal protein CcmA (bactofilin family)